MVITVPLGMVNVFLVRGERTILVDTGMPGSAPAILAAMKKHDIAPEDISLVLLTHAHLDHAGSVRVLRETVKAPLLVHQGDAEALRTGIQGKVQGTSFLGKLAAGAMGRAPRAPAGGVEPDLVIDAELDLAPYGVAGRAISTPGHTPGSLSVLLDSDEALVGDLIMAWRGRSRPNYPFIAADLAQVKASIAQLLRLAPHTIYLSHGGAVDLAALQKRFADQS